MILFSNQRGALMTASAASAWTFTTIRAKVASADPRRRGNTDAPRLTHEWNQHASQTGHRHRSAVRWPRARRQTALRHRWRSRRDRRGDTLTVLDESKTQHKIRLAGIDAPEKGQAFGTKARENLAAKVFRKTVRIEVIDVDRYHREVGRIYLGDRFINMEMVRDGFARRYVQYDKPGEFTAAEDDAHEHRRGLWTDPNPMAPWEWRKAKRNGSKPR
jgi:micrococcal nuclease